MKSNATIDVDEFESNAANVANDLRSLGREWQKIRKAHTGTELVNLLSITAVDILDSIAGIASCCTDECPELPFEDWDYCKKHGEEQPSETMSPALKNWVTLDDD